jgi:hypothetical protein
MVPSKEFCVHSKYIYKFLVTSNNPSTISTPKYMVLSMTIAIQV